MVATIHKLGLPGDVRPVYYTSPLLARSNIFRIYFTIDAGLKRTFLAKKLDGRLAGTDLFNTIHY